MNHLGGSPQTGFKMERRLRELDPDLHKRFTDAVFALQNYLSNYKVIFPEFTDHTEFHSLTVLDFCNQILGDQVERMNAHEMYALLMSCYLHDSGMGITMDMYREFSSQMDFGDYFSSHARDDYPAIIRDHHHEFSGLFIRKFAPLFDIPSEADLQAVVQVSRGHRRTDLWDETEYPAALAMPDGSTVCLPYLAALIRLADEIDVAQDRNLLLVFDTDCLVHEKDIMIYNVILAVKKLEITDEAFTVLVDTSDQNILEGVVKVTKKMQQVLDYCRDVVSHRTPYEITQMYVRLERVKK